MTNSNNKNFSPFKYHVGKASFFTRFKGSITVEASLAVPFFFFAVLCLLCMFEIMATEVAVRSGLQYAGKLVAEESYPLAFVKPSKIEEYVVRSIGADRLDRSLIMGGSTGIDCGDSYMSVKTGIGELKVRYRIQIPVPGFSIQGIEKEQGIRIKAWTGYEQEFFGLSEDETVYVTETGMVYHKDYNCTYLELSIQKIEKNNLPELRNVDGGKYHACWICGGKNTSDVYITNSGDRYHSSLFCSGLKRTVYAIPLSEAVGKGVCTRCGQ